MDIGTMETGTMRSGTIPGSNRGDPFCHLIITTTLFVIIVSIVIVIITIVSIHHPSSIVALRSQEVSNRERKALIVPSHSRIEPKRRMRLLRELSP
jgi:hypothetical protein